MDSHSYHCERCLEPVILTGDEWDALLAEQKRRRKKKLGNPAIVCDICLTSPPKKADAHPLAGKRRKNTATRPRTMPKTKGMQLRPDERAFYGVTVTVREQDTGELRSLVGEGSVVPALSDVCARIERMEGNWMISTISTPASIFRDLQGDHDPSLPSNEVLTLVRVGRRDLLEPKRKVYEGER